MITNQHEKLIWDNEVPLLTLFSLLGSITYLMTIEIHLKQYQGISFISIHELMLLEMSLEKLLYKRLNVMIEYFSIFSV